MYASKHKPATPTLEEIEAKFHIDPPSSVSIDIMVALKIVQHCKQYQGSPVTGQLLGYELDDVLYVTDSLPLPSVRSEEDGEDVSENHSKDMLNLLVETNVDTNTIGWYQSTFLGIHINKFLVDTQFGYQSSTPESVVITMDSLMATHGSLGLQAFRLSDSFMKLRKENSFTKEQITDAKISFMEILEEVPITMTSSGLSQAFIASLGNDPLIQPQYEHFLLSPQQFMLSNLEVLSYCFSDIQREQVIYGNWFRSEAKQEQARQAFIEQRKQQNQARVDSGELQLPEDPRDLEIENPSLFRKSVEPSQLDSLLLSYKIHSHCDQIIDFAGKSLAHQFVMQGIPTE